MSVPKFTTFDGSTYTATCTKGHKFPWPRYADEPNQEVEYTRDGYAVVRKNGDAKFETTIRIYGEAETVAETIAALFSAAYVDFRYNKFRYYPDKDTASWYEMRLLKKPEIQAIESTSSDRRYDIVLTAREE